MEDFSKKTHVTIFTERMDVYAIPVHMAGLPPKQLKLQLKEYGYSPFLSKVIDEKVEKEPDVEYEAKDDIDYQNISNII